MSYPRTYPLVFFIYDTPQLPQILSTGAGPNQGRARLGGVDRDQGGDAGAQRHRRQLVGARAVLVLYLDATQCPGRVRSTWETEIYIEYSGTGIIR